MASERYSFSLTTFRCVLCVLSEILRKFYSVDTFHNLILWWLAAYIYPKWNTNKKYSLFCSPSGKLVQIEYALAAVAAGAPSVGIMAANGVVLATENKHKSILYDEQSVHKVESIADHIGMVYSGMGPDYRLLVKQARKMAQNYYLTYREPIPVAQLVQRVATLMQEYTQSGGVRPFGVSLLICGWDSDRPYLFQCDPSGSYFAWKATAMGKNSINGKTFLEKRWVVGNSFRTLRCPWH